MSKEIWVNAYMEWLEEHPDDEEGAIEWAEGAFERMMDWADNERKRIKEDGLK